MYVAHQKKTECIYLVVKVKYSISSLTKTKLPCLPNYHDHRLKLGLTLIIQGGGGGCNPKKPNPYPRKGQTGIGFFWVFLGFLNIAILAEKYAYFYFPFKSFELPQYIFVQSMTPLNIGLHGNT